MSSPKLAVPLLLAVASLAWLSDALRARAHRSFVRAQTYEDVYYLPPEDTLGWFSLGHDAALADLIWMRALVYYGDEFQREGQVRFVFDYGEAIEALDPDFRAVYRWVGTAGMYRPTRLEREDIERSIAFMERGLTRFPEDGELAWELGAAYVFELAPLFDDPDDKDRVRERGLPYLMRAARLGAAPEWASLTNASLLERVGRTEQAASHLEEMYLAVDDPDMRERIANRIAELRERTEAEAFMAQMRELEEERRVNYPYLPPSLYLLVGPRDPLDLAAPIRKGLPAALSAPPAATSAAR
jgi:hypothetical protein